MAPSQLVTLTGNVTGPPELRYGTSGTAWLTLTLACNDRHRDATSGEWKDGDPFFTRVAAFGSLAERIADSVSKGDRVLVVGSFRSRKWADPTTGEDRYSTDLVVDDCGMSVRWAQLRATKVTGSKSRPQVPDTPADLMSEAGTAPF